ncbi:MAG: flippase-like domain-containing protein [Bacteroidales bacterium]|nr:flippase-like domain-containing protein [Bacteroidales bacterium]
MKSRIIKLLKILGFLSVGLILLWLAFRNVEFERLVEGLRKANYFWLLPSVAFSCFAFASRARRWILLINPLGFNPSFRNTFHSLMTGYLANLALPRLGEITRCMALGKKEKMPADQLFGTVIVERTIDFLSLLVILLILVILRGGEINEFLKVSIFIPLQEKVFSILGFRWIIWAVLLLLSAVTFFLLIRYRKNLRKFKFIARLFDIAKGIIYGLKTITTLERKWEFIFHTIFIWMNYALMTWVVVFAVKSTSHITLLDSVFLLVIGGLAMSAPIQSGLGAYHYIISRGLAFVEGVKIEDGLIYAFLTHESQMILVAILGTISFFTIFGMPHRRKSKTYGNE